MMTGGLDESVIVMLFLVRYWMSRLACDCTPRSSANGVPSSVWPSGM